MITNVTDFNNFESMQIEVLFFGITRDITGYDRLDLDVSEGISVDDLKFKLGAKHPKLNEYNYAVAINESYAENTTILKNKDIIALIPPVSGG